MRFNVNGYVRVKLTERGRRVHFVDHVALFAGAHRPLYYSPPVEDADGWSRWQLHDLMRTFGPHTGPGFGDLCFETEIEIDPPSSRDLLPIASVDIDLSVDVVAAVPPGYKGWRLPAWAQRSPGSPADRRMREDPGCPHARRHSDGRRAGDASRAIGRSVR